MTELIPPGDLVVLDSNCQTFDDVEVASCRVIPGMTRPKAHQHAWEIHQNLILHHEGPMSYLLC